MMGPFCFKSARVGQPRKSNTFWVWFKDDLLQAMVEKYGDLIGGYHEHDSLLQHKLEEELRDFEKKGAWSEFSGGNSG